MDSSSVSRLCKRLGWSRQGKLLMVGLLFNTFLASRGINAAGQEAASRNPRLPAIINYRRPVRKQ